MWGVRTNTSPHLTGATHQCRSLRCSAVSVQSLHTSLWTPPFISRLSTNLSSGGWPISPSAWFSITLFVSPPMCPGSPFWSVVLPHVSEASLSHAIISFHHLPHSGSAWSIPASICLFAHTVSSTLPHSSLLLSQLLSLYCFSTLSLGAKTKTQAAAGMYWSQFDLASVPLSALNPGHPPRIW